MDKMTGRPRGFAFVTMGTAEEAKSAAEKMNGTDLGGRQLTVNEARPKEDRPAGGFGGGGGGRGFGGGGGGRGFGGGGGGGGGGFGGRDRGERRY
jgi:RNA recognition motif-containing protein